MMFTQLVYGLIVATNAIVGPVQLNTSSNYPYLDCASQAEIYEGFTERRAAIFDRLTGSEGALAATVVTNPTYYSGYFLGRPDLAHTQTNTATGSFPMLSFSKWGVSGIYDQPVGWLWSYQSGPFYPFILRYFPSAYIFGNCWNLTQHYSTYFMNSYTATSVTPWSASRLMTVAHGPLYYPAYPQSQTNLWVVPVLSVSNVIVLRDAVSNLTMTTANSNPDYIGTHFVQEGDVTYYNGSTGVWTVAELAEGVQSVLDVSMICTQSIDTSSIPYVVSAENIDLSFVSAPVYHHGPSTNRLIAATVTAPTHPTKFYRMTVLRAPVVKWQFTRCHP